MGASGSKRELPHPQIGPAGAGDPANQAIGSSTEDEFSRGSTLCDVEAAPGATQRAIRGILMIECGWTCSIFKENSGGTEHQAVPAPSAQALQEEPWHWLSMELSVAKCPAAGQAGSRGAFHSDKLSG